MLNLSLVSNGMCKAKFQVTKMVILWAVIFFISCYITRGIDWGTDIWITNIVLCFRVVCLSSVQLHLRRGQIHMTESNPQLKVSNAMQCCNNSVLTDNESRVCVWYNVKAQMGTNSILVWGIKFLVWRITYLVTFWSAAKR